MQALERGERKFYYALEGLRGLAAILVAIRHLDGLINPIKFNQSYMAVDLFFLLSGFVIAASYQDRLMDGRVTKGDFVVSRAIWLYPLYLLGSVTGIFAIVLFQAIPTGKILLSLPIAVVDFPNLIPGVSPFLFNPPAWSLFFEFLASIAYGYWIYREGTLTLILVSLVGLAAFLTGLDIYRNGDFGFMKTQIPFGLARIAMSFTAGVLFFRFRNLLKPVPNLGNIGALAIYVVTIGTLMAPVPEHGLSAIVFVAISTTLLFPAIFAFAIATQPTGFVKNASITLGIISYPLYAIHAPVFALVREVSTRAELGFLAPYLGLICLACCMVLAWGLHWWFDLPVRTFLTQQYKKLKNRRSNNSHGNLPSGR